MKRYKLFVLLFIPLISSCFDDKGNYDYHEVAEITIEGLPELLEVVGGAEHIVAAPTVKSSLEGIITEDNPNFTFTYKMELKSGGTIVNGAYWGVTLNKNGRKDVDTLATSQYLLMYVYRHRYQNRQGDGKTIRHQSHLPHLRRLDGTL